MHRSIFADECEHFAHLFTVTICTTFSSVSLCVFLCVLLLLCALYLQTESFFCTCFLRSLAFILWMFYALYALAVIASGYSILIRSHSLLSVCTKILSQHLPNRIFQWICAYDKRHSEKNVNIHTCYILFLEHRAANEPKRQWKQEEERVKWTRSQGVAKK